MIIVGIGVVDFDGIVLVQIKRCDDLFLICLDDVVITMALSMVVALIVIDGHLLLIMETMLGVATSITVIRRYIALTGPRPKLFLLFVKNNFISP